jgi:hypothetical protein
LKTPKYTGKKNKEKEKKANIKVAEATFLFSLNFKSDIVISNSV